LSALRSSTKFEKQDLRLKLLVPEALEERAASDSASDSWPRTDGTADTVRVGGCVGSLSSPVLGEEKVSAVALLTLAADMAEAILSAVVQGALNADKAL